MIRWILPIGIALCAGCQPPPQPTTPPPPVAAADLGAPAPRGVDAVAELTPAQIGMVDQAMRGLIDTRSQLEQELAKLSSELGSEHPRVIKTNASLDAANKRIEAYAAEWRKAQAATARFQADRDSAELAHVFAGVVDIYLDPSELQSAKPAIPGASFDQAVEFSGRRMLRFTRAGEQWLVDPARIIAVRRAR